MGCNQVFRKKPGFWGPAIGFLVDVRSGFWLIGRSTFRERADRVFCGGAIDFLGNGRSNLREMCDLAIRIAN
ncbi:hypothetical protein QUB25_29180 [Microcoleus sp. B3-D7]